MLNYGFIPSPNPLLFGVQWCADEKEEHSSKLQCTTVLKKIKVTKAKRRLAQKSLFFHMLVKAEAMPYVFPLGEVGRVTHRKSGCDFPHPMYL